ncbi:DUF6484 domain-containing protein [Ideonella sp. A 288]|uniref:DUF6484 domain-containing protein n=1 Tax=Ideonella sp. A 288 TaxID=1962181 RepID=UPI001F2AB050|nr:DUF6484 domain-containing protein [Ideonella sp. A 288]
MNEIGNTVVLATGDGAATELDTLALLLAKPLESNGSNDTFVRIDGVRIGRLIGFSEHGSVPLVAFDGQPPSAPMEARATIELSGSHVGRQLVLMFENGDPFRPIAVGCLVDVNRTSLSIDSQAIDADVDGERVVLTAKERLVLRCGKASITLTKEGKVVVKGEYVSSVSAGVLRIKGGSVQIN